ncbi:MAG: HAMP domain-containing histidine kinase [Peptostreptococcaceae bacterium]|nr:HAMP domain-containing histidine kinase [Peptostreptococcaceae bacterium]
MDTKLRKISTHGGMKFLAFVIVVLALAAIAVQIQYGEYFNGNLECLVVDRYIDSEEYYFGDVQNSLYRVSRMIAEGGEVESEPGFIYYATDGEKSFGNISRQDREFYEYYDETFYYLENGEWYDGENLNMQLQTYGYTDGISDSDAVAYVAFTDEFIGEKQLNWEENRTVLKPLVLRIAASATLALLLIVFLVWTTGRKPGDRELHMAKIDSIYSDILLALFVPIILLWIISIDEFAFMRRGSVFDGLGASQFFSMATVGAATALATALCGVILLSLARKMKAGKLIKHSFVYVAAMTIYDFFKSLFDGRRFKGNTLTASLFKRQWVFIVASAAMVFLTFVFLFLGVLPLVVLPPVLEMMIVYWYIKGTNKTFIDINKGFDESMGEQMKAERMKIALVTNVSHDLKTPLTSMISYVDLLFKEEDLSPSARDYVQILSEKTNRLKNIVSDLFDLAKSSSGDISMEMETLDIKKLIEQTLGDMEDEVEKSGIQIKTELPDEPIMIFSDGKKLYRVFQNVLDNALKYSLEGSRIYMNLQVDGENVVATIKNTASYEMNFTEDEILQRFSRGDKSRTSEGSGLGLSIAESFTRVCGGNFKVLVDGDLFKVVISFKRERRFEAV